MSQPHELTATEAARRIRERESVSCRLGGILVGAASTPLNLD